MAVEKLAEAQPILLEFQGESVEVHIGDHFTLFNRHGFVLERATGKIRRSSTGVETPVLLFSFKGPEADIEDIYFPRAESEQEGIFYNILGTTIASAVLEERKKGQKE